MSPPWMQALQGGIKGFQGSKPSPYAQLGQAAGQMIGGVRNNLQNRKAMNSLNTDQPLQDSIGQAIDSTPPPSIPSPPSIDSPTPYQPDQPGMYSMDDNMAEGKLVTKPTIAILGENEPEAVIPLNNKPGNKVRLGRMRQYYGE